jgi:AcrR family transcriptional regulator
MHNPLTPRTVNANQQGMNMSVAESAHRGREAAGSATIRRSPIQGRSQDKVKRILAATARLAEVMPLESITMATIAEASGASFSSIYRFFPGKEAILEAVALTSLDRLQTLYEDYFAGPHPPSGAALIDGAIDIYVGFVAREPGFRALWMGGSQTPELSGRSRRVNETAIRLAKVYAVERLGFTASADLDLRLAIATEATTQILRYAFLQTEFPQARVISELKHWLKAALLIFG